MSLYPVSPFNIGLGLDTSASSSLPSPWIQLNLVDAPPAIIYQSVSSDTAYIYIPWVYPTQIHVGFIAQLLPLILSQTLRLYIPILSWNPQSIIAANTVNLGITGLVLTAKPPFGVSFTTFTFPGETIPRNVCLFSDVLLLNLPYSVYNRVNAFYSNYQIYSNDSYVIIPAYQPSGAPSAPRFLLFPVIGSTNMTISYTAPQYTDGLNLTTSPATITNYRTTYSTPGSTIRYGGLVPQSLQTDDYGVFLTHALATQIYPDSLYTISVYALNDINVNYSPALVGTQLSAALAQPAGLGALTFPSRFTATAYLASDATATTAITNLTITNSAWVSSSERFNINTTATRGTIGGSGSLVSLATKTVKNLITNNGPTTSFLGFPITTSATTTTNNITVAPTINTDEYTLTQQRGFYLNGNTTFTIGTALFAASPYETVFTATATPGLASTLSYYYDSVIGAPTVASATWDFGGTNVAIQISGVYVLYSTPQFAVVSSLTNMGTYFYRNNLVTYNINIGGITNTYIRTNVSVGVSGIVSGVMGTLGVSDTVSSASLSSAFSIGTNNTFLTSLVAANVSTTASFTTATRFSSVVDGRSYDLIFNIHAQTLPNTSIGLYVIGFRCYSGAVAYLSLLPAYLFGVLRYSTQAYNNTLLLNAVPGSGVQDQRQELQCCNGALRNSGSTINGWISYTTRKYYIGLFNTANYSGSSAITRYSTFAWEVANNASLYTSLSFNIYGLTGAAITVVSGIAYIGGLAIKMFYRLEDSNNAVPDGTLTFLSSVWCDAQSVNGNSSFVSAANYSSPGGATITTYRGGLNTGAVYSGGVLTLPVLFPCRQFSVTTTNMVLYARVGIPSGAGGFTYIEANIF